MLPEHFSGATMDSRQVKPGMLFAAIKGAKVDGHDFINLARAAGAVGILDGRDGLAAAAHEYRARLKAKVIGVTGSAGKTTTKELLAAFLRAGGYKVHATAGNFNNDLGLPLTLLNAPADADFVVLEMGTNHPGEIAYLVDIARPDIGVISSIGTAHIEFFKTQDGIADEKGTLFRVLPPDGFAVLTVDNVRHDRLAAMCSCPVVSVRIDDAVACRFAAALAPRLPGEHNVANARLAAACAERLGVSEKTCLDALADFALPGERWHVVKKNGVTYVSDCYNANPDAMIAALKTFVEMPASRHLAVLGDMLELGVASAAQHARVGSFVGGLGLDELVCVGAESCDALASAAARGSRMGGVHRVSSPIQASELLSGMLHPGDAVLLKASHSLHLESLLPA